MSGGNWSVIDLTQDPVVGDPGAVRSLATASQQEAQRWEQQVTSLRTIAGEGDAMEMEGDFAPVARRLLQSHPNEATALARGRANAGRALQSYAQALEQAKRQSQQALQQGTRAKQQRDTAERSLKQVQAQMRAMSGQVYPAGPAYAAAVQRFNMLRAQETQLMNQWQTAENQRMAARQQAVAAGEQASTQERIAAEAVLAAAPQAAAKSGRGRGAVGGSRTPAAVAATRRPPPGSTPDRSGPWGNDRSRVQNWRETWYGKGRPQKTPDGGETSVPGRNPSTAYRPDGKPEPIHKNADDQMRSDVRTQNKNANTLSEHGFDVRQQPSGMSPQGHPRSADYQINGRYFEHKVPHTSDTGSFIQNNLDKGAAAFNSKGTQADRFVVDLSNGKITPEALRAELLSRPPSGIQEVIVVQNGQVIPIFP